MRGRNLRMTHMRLARVWVGEQEETMRDGVEPLEWLLPTSHEKRAE